jgi:hypothetical protein
MAWSFFCDGCACNVAQPIVKGHVLKRGYCETCAQKAEAFLDAEEALRDACYGQFLTARQALINTSSASGFKLPDVP